MLHPVPSLSMIKKDLLGICYPMTVPFGGWPWVRVPAFNSIALKPEKLDE